MRRHLLLIFLLVVLMLMSSCSQIQLFDTSSISIKTPAISAVRFIASATTTPEPLLIVRMPSQTRSPMRIKLDVPDNVAIPDFYQLIDLPGIPHQIYAFTDTQNKTRFRVYADIDELEDGHITNTVSGFYEAQVFLSEENLFIIETDKESDPVIAANENPATLTTCPVPTKKNIRDAIRARTNFEKQYESDCSRASRVGEPTPTPIQWDGLPILDASTPEMSLPPQLKSAGSKFPNLYYYTDLYGDREYRRFATADGYDSGFYLSDENGLIREGSLKIDTSVDLSGIFFKQRKAAVRPRNNLYRLPVIIRLSNGLEVSVTVIYSKLLER